MEGQRIYRHCPEHHNSPCYNSTCEHQCFFEEKESREPEHHHHEKEPSEKTWEELMKKLEEKPWWEHAFLHFSPHPTIHIHNNIENILLTEEEHHHRKHRNKPIFALTITIKNQTLIMTDVQLVVGSPKTGIFTLIDNKTLLPITTASFSNQAVGANSNPEFASFALDTANPNNLIGTPIAAGSGTVVITTDASWTDAGDNSSQTGSFSVTKNYTVTPSADGASFDVVFP